MANLIVGVDVTHALMSIPLIWVKRANKDNVVLLRRQRERPERERPERSVGASRRAILFIIIFFLSTVIIFNDLLENVRIFFFFYCTY